MGSLLIACLAGCSITVDLGGDEDVRVPTAERVIQRLATASGVQVTDARCPGEPRRDQRLVCTAGTSVGTEDVIIEVGHDGTATARWRYDLIGGYVLAAKLAARVDPGRHRFVCSGQILVSLDPGSVVVCAEAGRESAHVVARGGARISAVYYDDAAAYVARAVGAGADRVLCPGPSVIRGLAPFACKVWRGERATLVTLTHGPSGWSAAARDDGPVALVE